MVLRDASASKNLSCAFYRSSCHIVSEGKVTDNFPISVEKRDVHLVDCAMVRLGNVELPDSDGRLEVVKQPPGGPLPPQLHHLLLAAGVVGGEEAKGVLLFVVEVVQAPATSP